MKLSIVIPTLNEAAAIQHCLMPLQKLRKQGHEIILVDGCSRDATRGLAEPLVDILLQGEKGRALQMNTGAGVASGDILVFLHGDTIVEFDIAEILKARLGSGDGWGRFDVRLSGSNIIFRVIEYLMNLRSRYSGIATGDQAMFISRRLFVQSGGFREIPLMEDIELSKRLKKYCSPLCLRQQVITSSRRWERDGIFKTIFKMWRLRISYTLGAEPERLARDYGYG